MKHFFRPTLFGQLLFGSLITAFVTTVIGVSILFITTRIEIKTNTVVNRLTPLVMLAGSFEKNIQFALFSIPTIDEINGALNLRLIAERVALINGKDIVALNLESVGGEEISKELSKFLSELEELIEVEAVDREDVSLKISSDRSIKLNEILLFAQRLTSLVNARLIEQGFELKNDSDFLRKIWLATFAMLIVFGIATSIFFSQRITRRVTKMLLAAREFSKGNFTHKIDLGANDELGELIQEMNTMAKELDELTKAVNTLKTELMSTASHQLLTPLSEVRWKINEITGELGESQDSLREKLETLHAKTVQMINFVSTLLDVSKLEGGRIYYDLKKLEISVVLSLLLEDAEAKARLNGLKFSYSFSDTSLIIKADTNKLSIAFKNIIDNAIRYTPSGGSVSVLVEREGDFVVVRVSDTGIGIPEEYQSHIFEKFFHAVNTQTSQVWGSGLGLYIVKTIILAHGGSVNFVSQNEKGTTFIIRLPLILE